MCDKFKFKQKQMAISLFDSRRNCYSCRCDDDDDDDGDDGDDDDDSP